jgi:hypothetical protein
LKGSGGNAALTKFPIKQPCAALQKGEFEVEGGKMIIMLEGKKA